MTLVEIVEGKFKAQEEYEYEITMDKTMRWIFRLGDAVCMMGWRDVAVSERPSTAQKHTQECVRSQSIVCPKCGEIVLVRIHDFYEGTEYDAFCGKCHWSSDDENGRAPINKWLDENNYFFSCECPFIEVPPQAPTIAEDIYRILLNKNEEKFRVVPKPRGE